MMILAIWAACGGGPPTVERTPAELKPDGVVVHVRDGAFEVSSVNGGAPLARVDWASLEIDPVDASDEQLVAAFRGASGVWVDLPPSLTWYRARKLFGSAKTAGTAPVFLSIEGGDAEPLRAGVDRSIGLKMSCRDGPLAWSGVQPRITLALQKSSEGSWAVANARFLPVVAGVPTDGLPSTCLAPRSCDDWYTGADAAACEAGRTEAFDGRVSLGGPVGCLLPFLNTPDDLASWTVELPPVLKGLGIDGTEPLLVSPEARIRWDTVMVTLGAFAAAGLPLPALGKPLVEGNDGPPMCDADVLDAASLSAAAARRAGTWMGPKDADAPIQEENEE